MKSIGRLKSEGAEVDVARDASGNFTFAAVGLSSLSLAVQLGHLQAKSFRGVDDPKWKAFKRWARRGS